MAVVCPRCGLKSPNESQKCECGHRFAATSKVTAKNIDERTLSEFGTIRLTDRRVVLETAESGSSSYVSITHDAIASCGILTSHQPWFIVLAVLSIGAAVVTFLLGVRVPVCVGLVAAGILAFAMYMASRSKTLSVASMGGLAIVVQIDDVRGAHAFLAEVEQAKLQMLNDLRQPHRDASTANTSAG